MYRGENMLAKIMSYGFWGIDGYEVKVEIDINAGIPGYDVVGLADTAVKESKERVRAAIKNSGFNIVDYFSQNNLRSSEANVAAKTGQAISDYYIILSKTGQDKSDNLKQIVFSKLGV